MKLLLNYPYLFIIQLFLLAGCEGERFYWETKISNKNFTEEHMRSLRDEFKIQASMKEWHSVFGQFCSGVDISQGQLFVCFKDNELRIVSSYPGVLKGPDIVNTNPLTVEKYLKTVSHRSGYEEHKQIKFNVLGQFKSAKFSDRLLKYESGSFIILNELSDN